MQKSKKNTRFGWYAAVFLVWFIMNIRVAAGIGSTFERAIDGLVGVVIILCTVFLALDFFEVLGNKEKSE